jgi:hypothetical protein
MPNDRPAVAAFRLSARIQSGEVFAPTPIIPSPPAADTAPASVPSATPAIGAHTTGIVTPRVAVSHVLIAVSSSAAPTWCGRRCLLIRSDAV